jgi:hypothetical protein
MQRQGLMQQAQGAMHCALGCLWVAACRVPAKVASGCVLAALSQLQQQHWTSPPQPAPPTMCPETRYKQGSSSVSSRRWQQRMPCSCKLTRELCHCLRAAPGPAGCSSGFAKVLFMEFAFLQPARLWPV